MSTDCNYLAAGLALGGLSDTDQAEVQALADADAELCSEVAAYEDILALMAESDAPAFAAPEPVSTVTRDAILAIPSTHTQEDCLSEPQSRQQQVPAQPRDQAAALQLQPTSLAEHRRKHRPWVFLAAAAAAIVVVAGIGANSWNMQQKKSQLEEELASTQQQLDESTRLMEAGDLRTHTVDLPEGGSVTVFSSENEQLIRFSPHEVNAAADGKSMQMWVISDKGPESVGLMTSQPITVAVEPFNAGSLFGITVEPEGGSDQPTTDPIVAIDL